MSYKSLLVVSFFLVSSVMIEPVFAAGSMRCGTHVISSGQNGPYKHEVLKRCGEPTAREGRTWFYKKSSSVTRIVQFNGSGQVSNIE
jgi:hypothetical protein